MMLQLAVDEMLEVAVTGADLEVSTIKAGQFPIRVKCATLPWHTLKVGLDEEAQPVSTE